MGKKRVTQLLEELRANQALELQNAAAIFTVAQVAVNELKEQAIHEIASVAALPPAPVLLDKSALLQRYGSYTACRKAAKAQGLTFSKTPTWAQLVAAFSHVDALQALIQSYVKTHANEELSGITIALKLG